MDTIQCPHCGELVEISQALKHQIESQVRVQTTKKHEKELALAIEKAKTEEAKKRESEFGLALKKAQEDSKDNEQKNKQLLEQITTMMQDMRMLKKEKDEAKLEMQKTLALEEEKIRSDAEKKAQESAHTTLMQKDKQIADAMKEIEDMKRRLQQGSQQSQGEVLELEFEDRLRREFPNDKVSPVAKGVRGADVVQEVWDRNGNFCGKILWEFKNTKTWSELWIDKLKADQRQSTADFAVIISEALPSDVESAKYYKGVWIGKRSFIIGLASSLRMNLIQVAMVKRAMEGKKDKMDILYTYLSGTEFRLRIEAIVEAFSGMQVEIEKEKRYFNNKWARDEKYIRQVIDNTYGMHGDLKGIIGQSLPEIKGLEALEDGNEH